MNFEKRPEGNESIEKVPLTGELFKELYRSNLESEFGDSVDLVVDEMEGYIVDHLKYHSFYPEEYIPELKKIQTFLQEKGFVCEDLGQLEKLISDVFDETRSPIEKEKAAEYFANHSRLQ